MAGISNNKGEELCATLGYNFRDASLLIRALTHSSFSYERSGDSRVSNEILEFLGDAVLNLAVAAYLVRHFPDRDEGDLSKMRAELVNERTLARIAGRIGLEASLRIGKSARVVQEGIPPSILADGVEALVGAVFQDGGYAAATEIVLRLLEPFLREGTFVQGTDYKTQLQEYTQKRDRSLPEYRLEGARGPEHLRVFESSVWIGGKRMGSGTGRSVKASEQEAARWALERLRETGNPAGD